VNEFRVILALSLLKDLYKNIDDRVMQSVRQEYKYGLILDKPVTSDCGVIVG
jgi:hypothetical protein